jgi:hypothetical protein
MNHTDLIDRYLRNELTENEKKQFEGLLSASDKSLEGKNLNDEMELQKEIIMAIQARGLKECLQKKETEIRAKRSQRQRIIKISSWSFASSLVAAVLVLAFITVPMAKIMQAESVDYAASISSLSRGAQESANHIQTLLSSTYTLVSQNQFQQADEQALQLLHLLQTSPTDLTSEEVQDIFEQAQWLHAVCVMNTGKVFKAKKLLHQIANSDSHYAVRAQDILDKL